MTADNKPREEARQMWTIPRCLPTTAPEERPSELGASRSAQEEAGNSMDIPTEKALLQHLKAGEASASKDLYTRFAGMVCAICRRYLSDEEDVKDAVQETFIRVFHHIAGFEYRQEGGLQAWIARIASNESLKMVRAAHLLPMDSLEDDFEATDEEMAELEQLSPETILELVRQLPEGYRTILNLYVFEEKSHKEIADILGISPMTSASQYCRAKRLLQKMITEKQKSLDR